MAIINGNGTSETLNGVGAENDTIYGFGGDDTLNGGGGNDVLDGGAGNDQIFGDITASAFNYNGKSYLLSNAGTWKQAQAQAVSLGGNLVTVNDAAENQFLVNTFGGTEQLWIGLTDEVNEGQFKWVNGEAVTYTNWIGGQPENSFGIENYAQIFGGTNGQWNDLANDPVIYGGGFPSVLRGIIEIQSNDTIIGSAGDDTINGGVGTDTVNYSSLTDTITLKVGGVVDKGIFGSDQILNVETVIGATGQANTIDASTDVATTTSLNVDLAVNRLTFNGLPAPVNSLTLNVQNFVNITGTTQGDTLKGNSSGNELNGNAGNDTIQGNGGDDILDGGEGNDQLLGGENNDQLYGGLGNDVLQGDNGNDQLYADFGNDTLRGGNGNDILDGGAGNDSLLGGANNDTLYGDVGDDTLNGEAGNDLLYGEEGNDRLFGGEGNDQLSGDQGRDLLYGGNGNDVLFGNEDNDSLFGDAGDDLLFGGKGNDLLQGGLGNDTFAIFLGEGFDTIQDFQDGFDKIGLGGLQFSQLTISQVGANAFIRNTSNGEFLFNVQNISSSLITSVDFVTVTV